MLLVMEDVHVTSVPWHEEFQVRNIQSYKLKESNKMQQYADIYLLLNYFTCFGRPSHPLSGARKTAVAASGTEHTIWEASLLASQI